MRHHTLLPFSSAAQGLQKEYLNMQLLLQYDDFLYFFLSHSSSGDPTRSFHALNPCCYSLSFQDILSWTKSLMPLDCETFGSYIDVIKFIQYLLLLTLILIILASANIENDVREIGNQLIT